MKSSEGKVKKLRGKFGERKSFYSGALIFMAVFAVIGFLLLLRSFAANPRLYLSPATGSVQTGNNFVVTVRLDPGGTATSGVDATVTYDQTKLQFVSVDTTTSAFDQQLTQTTTPGQIRIVRGAFNSGPVSSDAEVAKITFTALGSAAASTNIGLAGNASAANDTGDKLNPAVAGTAVSITVPTVTKTASFTVEPTTTTPVTNSPFGLKLFVNSNANIQGGEVIVNLPSGVAYQGTLDTTGTAFNPATTVTGTTAQSVHIVFVTQSTTLTGKQLVATIPVLASATGSYFVTFAGARVADTASVEITSPTANPVTVVVNAASIPKPVVTISGRQLATTENVTDFKQSFSISNFDATSTYAVTIGGQTLTVNGGGFSLPTSLKNGDYTLQVTVSKTGATNNTSSTIRLRSPNVNRTACVEFLDLLAVNQSYGKASTEFDLNFDGTVGLIDLLTVTAAWSGACA